MPHFVKKIISLIRFFKAKQPNIDFLLELQTKNPTCIFYNGCNISESILSKYNVIFNNVTLYKSILGAHTYIQKNSRIHNAKIGNFCSIASNVSIGLGKHKINGLSTHPSFYLKNTPLAKVFATTDEIEISETVFIEHDVWIGEGVIILDGVSIGTGAIIAAGAVVTKNVEPYTIMGGVPAKLIKYRFDESIRVKLLESKWWNKSDVWLLENFKKLENEIISKT